ncbi:STAS domain-containing protein [Flavivirga jejuensis]|uniref:STAS domain-containing protein n=1 Tax=Flavivirga jejuensis TaxID=870487 RepID=A0ABT8WPQ2_9FLAO|nr:STAS domain-containing protein [Flavivirga jejuensis]MDO5975142.1 STAS domain-containing protein [Flavivirga jejuensis]
MAFKITNQNGTSLIEGTINASTALYFQDHLESILNLQKALTIDIENVTEIDASGMQALRTLYNNALSNNKPFHILGTGCKEVYDDLISFLH